MARKLVVSSVVTEVGDEDSGSAMTHVGCFVLTLLVGLLVLIVERVL